MGNLPGKSSAAMGSITMSSINLVPKALALAAARHKDRRRKDVIDRLCGGRRAIFNLASACILMLGAAIQPPAQSAETLEIAAFSSSSPGATLPDGWRPLTFPRVERHTDYSLVEDEGSVVLKAVSDASASGLTRAVSIDPRQYPVIQWRWKVGNVLRKGDVTRKDGDDYAARIYITFAFDPDKAGYLERLKHTAARLVYGEAVPYRAMAYIWGSNNLAGTMVANAYTDRVMMFVVRSGEENLQQWVTQQRNVYTDYRRAFGDEPTTISAVAIMTDSDNTGESAVAWYGDIAFMAD